MSNQVLHPFSMWWWWMPVIQSPWPVVSCKAVPAVPWAVLVNWQQMEARESVRGLWMGIDSGSPETPKNVVLGMKKSQNTIVTIVYT